MTIRYEYKVGSEDDEGYGWVDNGSHEEVHM